MGVLGNSTIGCKSKQSWVSYLIFKSSSVMNVGIRKALQSGFSYYWNGTNSHAHKLGLGSSEAWVLVGPLDKRKEPKEK